MYMFARGAGAVNAGSVPRAWTCEDRTVELVLVFSAASVPEGHLAKGRLEAEGIPVLVKGEGEGPYRMGPVHLWVPSELEGQARLVLESLPSGEGADWSG